MRVDSFSNLYWSDHFLANKAEFTFGNSLSSFQKRYGVEKVGSSFFLNFLNALKGIYYYKARSKFSLCSQEAMVQIFK